MSIKYYKIKLSSLQNTFSKVEAGTKVNFEIQNSSVSLSTIKLVKDDLILVSQGDEIYYSFRVLGQNDNTVQLHKIFEIKKNLEAKIDKEGVLIAFEKEEYNSFCYDLFLTKKSL